MRTEGSLVRTPPPPPSVRLVTTRRGLRESRRAELYFCSPGKTVWTDASQLVGSGRSRIVGYCNRPKTCATWAWPTLYPLGFSQAALYKVCTACAARDRTNLGFATSRSLRRHRTLLHPERRRPPANGREGLRNHSPLRSCTGEGELGFWEALRATARCLHHGSSTQQVGRCCVPPPQASSTPSRHRQRRRQQHRCTEQFCYICKRSVCVPCFRWSDKHVRCVHVLRYDVAAIHVVYCI